LLIIPLQVDLHAPDALGVAATHLVQS
jgi:hypothetical protein